MTNNSPFATLIKLTQWCVRFKKGNTMTWCIDYTNGDKLEFVHIEANSVEEARDKFEQIFDRTDNIEEISCVA